MTRIKIKNISWDKYNLEHIKKHKVSVEEIIEAGKNFAYHKETYNNRYLAIGRSGKRILALVIRREDRTKYYLVTARDANKKEREKVYEKEILRT